MRRVLTLAGGAWAGPFAQFVEDNGCSTDPVDPSRSDASRLERGGFDVVFAVGHFAEGHSGRAGTVDRRWGEAMCGFVTEGGGLVATRAATQWFNDWDHWPAFLGGWRILEADTDTDTDAGRDPAGDLDPAPGAVAAVEFASRSHPVVAGLAPLAGLGTPPACYRLHDAQPLGHFGRGAVVWSATRGAGRVVVDTLAYDADSLTLPANRAILSRALRWVSET